jgi:hypothetical protein
VVVAYCPIKTIESVKSSQLNQFKLLINSDCYIYLYLILIDKDCHMGSGLFLVGERNMSQLFAKECFLLQNKNETAPKKKKHFGRISKQYTRVTRCHPPGGNGVYSKPLNKKKKSVSFGA